MTSGERASESTGSMYVAAGPRGDVCGSIKMFSLRSASSALSRVFYVSSVRGGVFSQEAPYGFRWTQKRSDCPSKISASSLPFQRIRMWMFFFTGNPLRRSTRRSEGELKTLSVVSSKYYSLTLTVHLNDECLHLNRAFTSQGTACAIESSYSKKSTCSARRSVHYTYALVHVL